ncbi:hypothetical protein K7X08_034769 [Anisodus acutangulus]|uniref:Uncharacterized protein n=1 Tax=Anisodus acutangulus TaxID=402998 RepID=A0A9Q1LG36_9SOLA|nr:hypothetical protein K7X08_034769 [Anisodus acutangulus]
MQARRELSESLSFNSYSNKNLAEIADRVVEEFKAENETHEDFFIADSGGFSCNENEKEQGNADDDEFEFSFIKESEILPVAADEIFYNGQIRPIYPIFNRDLLSNNDDIINGRSHSNSTSEEASARLRLPLRKLFLEEEREANSSCSSSEADDLESIPAGTYCVWRPKETEKPDGSCKKSNSTGSSKRWKFRDLLHRSNSDGKDTFVFLTPLKKKEKTTKTDNAPKVTAKLKGVPAMHYVKNGEERRKTYLPYRQDLVGFFANMNG